MAFVETSSAIALVATNALMTLLAVGRVEIEGDGPYIRCIRVDCGSGWNVLVRNDACLPYEELLQQAILDVMKSRREG